MISTQQVNQELEEKQLFYELKKELDSLRQDNRELREQVLLLQNYRKDSLINSKQYEKANHEKTKRVLNEKDLENTNLKTFIDSFQQKNSIIQEFGDVLDENTLLETAADKRHEMEASAYPKERTRLKAIQFVSLLICCAGVTLFWIHASRLYTEPNIIQMSPEFNNDCDGERSNYADVVGVTAGIMIFDFIRTFLMIMVIPTSFIWYSYYIEDSESKNLDLELMKNFGSFVRKQILFTLVVAALSFCSLASFIIAEQYLSILCPTDSSDAVLYSSSALFMCSIINPFLYFFQVYHGSKMYERKSVSDGTFITGLRIVVGAICCCAKTPIKKVGE